MAWLKHGGGSLIIRSPTLFASDKLSQPPAILQATNPCANPCVVTSYEKTILINISELFGARYN